MNIQDYMMREGEQPLERMAEGGGFAAIFRTFACVGDSLSSGEFETISRTGEKGYHDLFDYSWGQFMARAMGSKCLNFSRGGMTAREYMETFAEQNGFWAPDKACQAYIIAMGCNDISVAIQENTGLGAVEDVSPRWQDNKKTFAGHYAAIIQRYKEIAPDAKFFLLTMPRDPDVSGARLVLEEEQARLMHALANRFENAYVVDLRRYAPLYDAAFKENFFLHGHMNPAGYLLTAKMVMSYMDYIIRLRPRDFTEAGLINTPFVNEVKG